MMDRAPDSEDRLDAEQMHADPACSRVLAPGSDLSPSESDLADAVAMLERDSTAGAAQPDAGLRQAVEQLLLERIDWLLHEPSSVAAHRHITLLERIAPQAAGAQRLRLWRVADREIRKAAQTEQTDRIAAIAEFLL